MGPGLDDGEQDEDQDVERGGDVTSRDVRGGGVAGLLVGVGTALSNGCTSGHAISGGLQLAVSSWTFIIAMFVAINPERFRSEPAGAARIEVGLGEHGAGGVARAQEKHVPGLACDAAAPFGMLHGCVSGVPTGWVVISRSCI